MSDVVVHEYLSFIAAASGWFLAGMLLGLLHFVSLRLSVRCLLGGRPLFSFGLQLLRFALTGGALALVAKLFGAMPLLAGAVGLMAARTRMLRLEPK
ncbi:MAG TPA: ATP synthase subunit I [Bradyrhizobium sp.]|nr:ATP synthase subunit I [Bradyrhizobium sp.]